MQFQGRVHLYVRMCLSLSRISGTAGRIALKFGLCLETYWLLASFTQTKNGVHLHVRMCILFRILGTTGRIPLKLEWTHWNADRGATSYACYTGDECVAISADPHPFSVSVEWLDARC